MKKLLNTLYITSPDTYLALIGENVVVKKDEEIALRVPLHNLEAIVAFNYSGASPALIRKCGESGINLSFFRETDFVGVLWGRKTETYFCEKYNIGDQTMNQIVL